MTTLDPIRAAALQAAVAWLPTRWAADGTLDPAQVLEAADRFAIWLVSGDQAEQIPVDPHPYILEQRPYPTADGQCLLITGPGRICGRRRDDPVHQSETP